MTISVSNYSKDQLTKMHVDTFRKIVAQYGKGRCVGVGSWQLRVTNNSCALVTSYQTKGEDGQWSGVNEYVEVL